MAILAQFGELKFEIASTNALLFENLKVSSGCETEDKSKNKQKYVVKKNGEPVQVNFAILLNASLGIDVEWSIGYLMYAAQGNVTERLYMGRYKMFPCKMMMVKADVEEIKIAPDGTWTSAKVQVTMKQCTEEAMPKKQWKQEDSNLTEAKTAGKASAVMAAPVTVNESMAEPDVSAAVQGVTRTIREAKAVPSPLSAGKA